MNTFMPYSDFLSSVKCLDNKRLGKQRLECYQMIQLFLDENKTAWRRHPAFVMWHGHPESLVAYFFFCCNEFRARGYNENLAQRMIDEAAVLMNSHKTARDARSASVLSRLMFSRFIDIDTNSDYLPIIQTASKNIRKPQWVDHPLSISGYRSNLLRKDSVHYGQFGWTEPPDLEYFWGGLLKLKKLLGKNYKHYYLQSPGIRHVVLENGSGVELTIEFGLDFLMDSSSFKLFTTSEVVSYFVDECPSDFQRIPIDKFSKIVNILKKCHYDEEIRRVLENI